MKADELLGSSTGPLVTDAYSGYNRVPEELHPLCWPRLIRILTNFAERIGRGGRLDKQPLLVALVMIPTRHRFRDQLIDEPCYYQRMNHLRQSFHSLLESGARL